MRVLAVVLLIALASMCAAEESVWDDWWGMLEMQGGETFDFKAQTWKPYLAAPVVGYKAVRAVIGTEIDIDENTEAKGPVTGLLGLTYNIGNLKGMGVDMPWMEHVGFNVGVCGTYEFQTGDIGWKAMVSILDISTDKGNVERQKKRGGEDKLTAVEEEDQEWGSIKAMYR